MEKRREEAEKALDERKKADDAFRSNFERLKAERLAREAASSAGKALAFPKTLPERRLAPVQGLRQLASTQTPTSKAAGEGSFDFAQDRSAPRMLYLPARAMHSSSTSTATSASSLLTTSGGAMRIVLGPQPRNSKPRSKASSIMRSRASAAASSGPRRARASGDPISGRRPAGTSEPGAARAAERC